MVIGAVAGKVKPPAGLTADIAVFKGSIHRPTLIPVKRMKGKKEITEYEIGWVPVDAELHLNPVSLGVGAVTAAIGLGVLGLLGTAAWHGVAAPNAFGGSSTIFPGLKGTEVGDDLHQAYQTQKFKREYNALLKQNALCVQEAQKLEPPKKGMAVVQCGADFMRARDALISKYAAIPTDRKANLADALAGAFRLSPIGILAGFFR